MDEHAFLSAYDAYADAIFRHCYFRVADRERARDLVQETFLRTWEYLAAGHRVENIRAFLYRVANNLIIDAARKERPLSLDALREEGFDPPDPDEGRAVERVEANRLLALLDRLPSGDRDLIVMRYVDELGPKEIAAIIGTSENVISVRLYRAMARFRNLIRQPYGIP